MIGVLPGVTGDIDDMDVRIGKDAAEFSIGTDGRGVLRGELGIIELAGRTNGSDLGLRAGIDGCDMSAGGPAVTDNRDVVLFHAALVIRCDET